MPPERAHFVLLAPLGLLRDRAGIGARHAAALLDAPEVGGFAEASRHRPARPAGEHRVYLPGRQVQRSGAAEAGGDAYIQQVREPHAHRLEVGAPQAGVERAHAAGDVETDPACRHHTAVLGIEGRDPADRKAVSPMGIRHRIRGADDARQHRDLGDLLVDLVVHRRDQLARREDHRGHTHRAPRPHPPFEIGLLFEAREVHDPVLLRWWLQTSITHWAIQLPSGRRATSTAV